jgi:hypothetical protein
MHHLPDDYDISKEPEAAHRCQPDKFGKLSGACYVLMLLPGETKASRVKVATKANCQHGITICDGQHIDLHGCAESWQYDHSILWSRTDAGRRLISQMGLNACKNQNPNHPAARYDRLLAASQAKKN